ncbi:MAG: hypothetical protein CVU99_07850 [Firmicutes bacterium HGW-Firmicutes-4]|jgi:GT2 family glycosyltransferase|nr:MAG: hypothetical protein CVU99_07850 [Firmicutes bacterium HGW-Firmicutes-4]
MGINNLTERNLKYGFVILHYMAFEMTVECVEKLLSRFVNCDIQIVIVDNCSSNRSGKKLNRKYSSTSRVTVLLNEKNDGFAKGNNLGYKYLRENYDPDYMIVMNNDVLIEQVDFLDLIDNFNRDEGFSVAGPDIYCPVDNKHQNPAHLKGFTLNQVQALYDEICKYSSHPAFYYYKHVLFGGLKRSLFGRPATNEKIDRKRKMQNVVLHGACYIFTRDFITAREQCFCPATFLYMEEDILHYECTRDGLKMLYLPDLKIKHLEDVSTNASIKSGYARFKMKNNEMQKSIRVLIDIMRN